MIIVALAFHEFSLKQTDNPTKGKITVVRFFGGCGDIDNLSISSSLRKSKLTQILCKAWICDFNQLPQHFELKANRMLRHLKVLFLWRKTTSKYNAVESVI